MATDEGLPAKRRRVIVETMSRDLDLAIQHWGDEAGAQWLKQAGEELAALKIIHTTDAVVKRHAARMAAR
jgi:ABC-type Fe3+ transport system substrate-binding protein